MATTNSLIVKLLLIALIMRIEAIKIHEIVISKGKNCYYLTGYDKQGNIIHARKHNTNP
jgi:Xaa-Pro aminopeptidase